MKNAFSKMAILSSLVLALCCTSCKSTKLILVEPESDMQVRLRNQNGNKVLTANGNTLTMEDGKTGIAMVDQVFNLVPTTDSNGKPLFLLSHKNKFVKASPNSFVLENELKNDFDFSFESSYVYGKSSENTYINRPLYGKTLLRELVKGIQTNSSGAIKSRWTYNGNKIALDTIYMSSSRLYGNGHPQLWRFEKVDYRLIEKQIEEQIERERIANIPVIDTSKSYIIRLKHSGKALDYGEFFDFSKLKMREAQLYQSIMQGGAIQQWKFSYGGNQEYIIKNVHKNQVLSIKDGSTKYEAAIVLENYRGGADQRFKLINNGSNWRIVNVKSQLSFDLSGGANELNNGQPVIQYQWHGGDNQRFEIFPASDIEFYRERDPTITFFNEGGYVARYSVYYNGAWRHETGDVTAGFKEEFTIPARAKDIRIYGKASTIIDWTTIFNKDITMFGSDYCIKTYGAVWGPEYNNNCRRWNPFADSTVHVTNMTGEKVYVGWSNEVIWGLTNMTAGILTGLIIDNTQNLNSSYYKLIAVAAATGIELPKGAYELFKDAAIEIDDDKTKKVIEHSPLGTLKNFFEVYTGAKEFTGKLIIETAKQSDEYKAKYVNYNPILAIGDAVGAETKTIMAVNASLTKFWIVDSGIDDSWIIKPTEVYKSKYGTLKVKDPQDPRTQPKLNLTFDD